MNKVEARLKRKKRIRKKISGTKTRPRLTVFRSNKNIYAQLINDEEHHTLASASSNCKTINKTNFETKVSLAHYIGKLIGEKAIEQGIKYAVFDRNGYLYHGRVKAVSNGAREAGLIF